MNDKYFMDNLDLYSTKYGRIGVMGDFNLEPSSVHILALCCSLYNLVNENTCFKVEPKCYDLMLTNCKHNFQNTAALTTGFSDFHKMTLTILKTEYGKADPIQINYRNYKNFSPILFKTDLRSSLMENELSNRNFDTSQITLYEILINSPFMT